MRNRDAFASGDVIGGRYVLCDLLGVGGMGVVFAARQPALERTVAVKVLRPELRESFVARRRFREEAIAGSRLSHPNIVSVFDYGEPRGAPFLAMQRLSGTPLGQLSTAAPGFSLVRASHIVEQVLAALVEAHRLGIVHGDVKSDNVLVESDEDGTDHATMIDFGLVRIADRPVVDGEDVSGTPEYMAPEIVLGNAPTVRSDIYAVGCVLYELVTGVVPYGGGTVQGIMSRHVDEALIPPSVRVPDLTISRDYEEVIAIALAKNPRERFATAADFAVALQAVTPDDEVMSHLQTTTPLACSSCATTLDWPGNRRSNVQPCSP